MRRGALQALFVRSDTQTQSRQKDIVASDADLQCAEGLSSLRVAYLLIPVTVGDMRTPSSGPRKS